MIVPFDRRTWLIATLVATGLHAGLAVALLSAASPRTDPAGGGASAGLRLALAASMDGASADVEPGSHAQPEVRAIDVPAPLKPLSAVMPGHEPVVDETADTTSAADDAPAMVEETVADAAPELPLPARADGGARPLSPPVPAIAGQLPVRIDVPATPDPSRADTEIEFMRPASAPVRSRIATRRSPPVPASRPRPVTVRPEAAASVSAKAMETAEQAVAPVSNGGSARGSSPEAGAVAGAAARADPGNAGPAGSGGADLAPDDDFLARLQAWLDRHKDYPARARSRRQQGVVMLQFSMDRVGRVLDYRIARSSGHRLLDHAVEKMIRRAEPLPALPDRLGSGRLELVLPIRFSLR